VYEGGVHVRTIVTRETEWTPDQSGLMLALAYWRGGLCHRCHGELAETTNPMHDADRRDGTHAYKATPPTRCHRCTALVTSERAYSTNELVRVPEALIHHVDLVPRGRR
jgi:hypothetical protein